MAFDSGRVGGGGGGGGGNGNSGGGIRDFINDLVNKSTDLFVGKKGVEIPSKPVDMGYATKAHVSAGEYYTKAGSFHGAIDVSTKTTPNIKALAMFNVELVKQKNWWTPKGGWRLIMRILDDYSINGRNCKGLYLVYLHLAEEPVKYLIKEGYIESEDDLDYNIKISAGKPVGIVGDTGDIDENWKPKDGKGTYAIHLHLHLQPRQNSDKDERIGIDQLFIDMGDKEKMGEKVWYKRRCVLNKIDYTKIDEL